MLLMLVVVVHQVVPAQDLVLAHLVLLAQLNHHIRYLIIRQAAGVQVVQAVQAVLLVLHQVALGVQAPQQVQAAVLEIAQIQQT